MYEIYERLRNKRKLSDYRVASEIGISRSTLSDWRTGKHHPELKTLTAIANYFNVTIDYLLGNKR